jgi:hypothetical protein
MITARFIVDVKNKKQKHIYYLEKIADNEKDNIYIYEVRHNKTLFGHVWVDMQDPDEIKIYTQYTESKERFAYCDYFKEAFGTLTTEKLYAMFRPDIVKGGDRV